MTLRMRIDPLLPKRYARKVRLGETAVKYSWGQGEVHAVPDDVGALLLNSTHTRGRIQVPIFGLAPTDVLVKEPTVQDRLGQALAAVAALKAEVDEIRGARQPQAAPTEGV